MKWIGTNGGPFIVLPWAQRAEWAGADPPRDGRVVKAKFRWDGDDKPATDYDEACERTEPPTWFGLVKRKAFAALALPMYSKTWVPRPRGGIIVHCETAPSEKHSSRILRDTLGPRSRAEPVEWKRTRFTLTLPNGRFLMHDAAYPGGAAPKKMTLDVRLNAGVYAISLADWAPDDETSMTLYRLTR